MALSKGVYRPIYRRTYKRKKFLAYTRDVTPAVSMPPYSIAKAKMQPLLIR